MTQTEFMAWHINSLTFYIRLTAHSENERAIATRRQNEQELAMMRTVSRHLSHLASMPPDVKVWFQWIIAVMQTYKNNPRENEAQNNRDRDAARERRDAELLALSKGEAA